MHVTCIHKINVQHSVEEGQAENIELDDVKTCTVTSNAYRHFVLVSNIENLYK